MLTYNKTKTHMTPLTVLTKPLANAAFSTPSTVAWATSLASATAVSAAMLACSVVFWATDEETAHTHVY